MITRIVMLMLVAVLALPVSTFTSTRDAGQRSWSDVSISAKGKHHKRHKRAKTDKRTVRQPVTQTFTRTAPLTIPSGAPIADKGPANPYPSAIAVSGFDNGVITDVNLIFTDLTHGHYDDLDILLSTNDGRQAHVMSDVADLPDVADEDIDLILDDEAAAALPGDNEYLRSGTFRPTNIARFDDSFAAPAPTPNGNVALSVFDGANPNGTWNLWVMDTGGGDYGDLGAWAFRSPPRSMSTCQNR